MAGTRTTNASQTYLLECFWPGVTEDVIAATALRARRAARELTEAGRPVRYLGSQLVPGDEVVFFEVEADSEEAAGELGQQAEIPFERVVGSVRVPASREGKGKT
jgi:hypothetical protein